MKLGRTYLENVLETDLKGKPILKLIPLKKTAVNTSTQESYTRLLRVYEVGGWHLAWKGYDKAPPTKFNQWKNPNTCISAGDSMWLSKEEGRVICLDKSYFVTENYVVPDEFKIISTGEFYKIQKITLKILREIDKYFRKNETHKH